MLVVMPFMLMIMVMAFVFVVVTFVFMIVIVCGLSGMARTAGKQISAHYAYPIYFLQHVFCY